jgi:hypothetical protein
LIESLRLVRAGKKRAEGREGEEEKERDIQMDS